MKIIRISTIFTIGFLLSQLLYAGAGTTAGIILKETIGARSQGMGDAFTAVATGAETVYWNSAGLANMQTRNMNMMYLKNIADTNFASICYAQPLAYLGGIGFCIEKLTSENLEVNYLNGFSKNITAIDEYIVNIALGKKIFGINAGINTKYIKSTIAENYTASALTMDAGFLYKFKIFNGLAIGINFQNISGGLKYIDVEDPLPSVMKAGASYHGNLGNDTYIIAADINKSKELSEKYNTGIEYLYHNLIAVRIGYKFGYDADNITSGFGIKAEKYFLDYGFASRGELGNNHRLSISIDF